MPGSALAIGRTGGSVPRASRRRSMIVRTAGMSVSITIRLRPTPIPATTPKSPIAPMGEIRFVRKLTIVVAAASVRGMTTLRSPTRTALATGSPAIRCSR